MGKDAEVAEMERREAGRIFFQPADRSSVKSRGGRPKMTLKPRIETLEDRRVPAASLNPIANLSIAPGQGFQIPLETTNTDNQTYSVTSSNPEIKATVSTGEFMTINVTHASSGPNDPAFQGSMVYQLFDHLTPIATSRIEELVNQGFYTGKNFHRVANQFPDATHYIVQGGSVNGNGTGNINQPGFPFPNEILPQLSFNGTYQLALANAGPNTNESQFFVTTGSPTFLNGNYTIFGQLVSGQAIVQDMTKVALNGTTPVSPILMSSVTLSKVNPDGVLHIDATAAGPGQTSNVTVTATDPATHTTATQTFTVTTTGSSTPIGNTGAVRQIGPVLIVDPPVSFTKNLPYNIAVGEVGGAIQVMVNGEVDTIQPPASSIQYIIIYGNKGNDNIQVSKNVTIPMTIDGGHGGVNVLQAGGGVTTIHGWFGYNTMIGGPQDSLIGRKGRVRFIPTAGGDFQIFAGVPHVTRFHTYPPSGTFYTFVNNRLVPVSEANKIHHSSAAPKLHAVAPARNAVTSKHSTSTRPAQNVPVGVGIKHGLFYGSFRRKPVHNISPQPKA